MLIQLKIENIALIEIIEINFEKGLNIITGDSGSGKSLILDSLNALFGGTNIPLKHLIRPGKDFCVIEAIFSSSFQINNWLISNGFQTTSSELQIKRKSFKKNNKILSKYSLNDLPINKQSLEQLGRFLIDFAGQSDTFIFDSQEKRRLIIDDLCSQESKDTSERIKSIWGETNFLEKELKQNLSLKNVSVIRQIFPFGLKIEVNTRTPIAYGERIVNDEKILGYIDKDGIFINKNNVDEKSLSKLAIQVFGWKEEFKKILSEILNAQKIYEYELVKITFSPNGFLTVEEKDLKTIFLGFNPNLINYQLLIINNIKNELKKNNFSEKIDNIDLSDPYYPKIKVFKP